MSDPDSLSPAIKLLAKAFANRGQSDAPSGMVKVMASCVLAIIAIAAAGQDESSTLPRYVIQRWGVENGLPSNEVTCIARSRQGYLYVGTTLGLARFDGVQFRSFDLSDGLKPNRIHAIREDQRSTLWVATIGGGLARLVGDRFVCLTRADGLPSDSVTALAEDGRDRLWIGTRGGLAVWDGRQLRRPDDAARFDGCHMTSILCESDGTTWVGVFQRGLFTYERGRWSESPASTMMGPGVTCYALFKDREGRIWASTDHEVVLRRDASGWTSCRVKVEPPSSYAYVKQFTEDEAGILWCALAHGNLNYFRRGRDEAEEFDFTPSTPEVECVLADFGGELWIGTKGLGLHRLVPPKVSVVGQPEGLATRTVHTVAEPEPGVLWAGTHGGGIYRLIEGAFQRVEFAGATYNSAFSYAFCPAPDGSCWAALGDGLYRFRDGRQVGGREYASTIGENGVFALIEDREGGLWMGTTSGRVFHLSGGSLCAAGIETHGHAVTSLAQARDGSLWIGTRGAGVMRYSSRATERTGSVPGLDGDEIWALLVDPDDTLWIGTVGRGLARWRQGRLDFFTSRHGLPADTVRQILDDGAGGLWLGMNRGIVRLSRAELDALADGRIARLYPLILDLSDGLLSEECSTGTPVRLRSGRLAFPTMNGVALIDPSSSFPRGRPPRVRIEGALVNGTFRTITSDGTAARLVLAPDERRVEFRYTSLLGASPENARFRVRLRGIDRDWVDVEKQRSVIYSYLPAGQYRFEAAVCDRNGYWNPDVDGLDIDARPHFWETWMFQAGLGLVVALGLAAAVRLAIRRRYQRQLAEVERRHELERERARIARDLHDDLGARLTQVNFWSSLAADEAACGHDPKVLERMEKIRDHSIEIVRSLDEAVWAINPKNDTVSSVADYLCQYADEFMADTPILCRKDIADELPAEWLSADRRHHLFLAAKEALHNAVKHSGTREIWLRVLRPEERVLEIVIEDHGVGFDPGAVRPGGNGLDNIRRRMAEIGGRCEIETGPRTGTRVRLGLVV